MTGEARIGGIDHGHDPQRRGGGLCDLYRHGGRGTRKRAGDRAGALSALHGDIVSIGRATGRRSSAAHFVAHRQQIRS